MRIAADEKKSAISLPFVRGPIPEHSREDYNPRKIGFYFPAAKKKMTGAVDNGIAFAKLGKLNSVPE